MESQTIRYLIGSRRIDLQSQLTRIGWLAETLPSGPIYNKLLTVTEKLRQSITILQELEKESC